MSEVLFKVEDLIFRVGIKSWGPWSFSFRGAQTVGVIGPNGAGKSTFFHSLLGAVEISQGIASLDEHTLNHLTLAERRGLVALIPQESPYPADWTVEAAVGLGLAGRRQREAMAKSEMEAEMARALKRFGLADMSELRLGQLSSGQRQRVFLARVFLQSPRILLLDEPTNHLDPPTRELFWNLLDEIQSDGNEMLVIVATHDLGYLKRHAQGILALNAGGEVVYSGSSPEFWDRNLLAKTFGRELPILE